MNMVKELKATADSSATRIPEETRKVMGEFQEELEKINPLKNMIKVGDKFPSFRLKNHKGEYVSSEEILKKGPIVMAFYRGSWCPYCNIELRAYQEILPELKKKGAYLVAVSPEKPDKTVDLVIKHGLDFTVLNDDDNKLAKEIGIVFQLNGDVRKAYKGFGIDLVESNGNEKFELPVPATFVIGQDGKVIFAEANLDYRLRTDPEKLLKYL